MLPGVWHLLSQQTVKNGKVIWTGYGAAWRLYFSLGNWRGQEWTFGHCQNRQKQYEGKNLGEGVCLGQTDNTGDSTGPHLHIGVKLIQNGKILNPYNGFGGSVDPLPIMKKLGMKFTNA
jgi:murein DD-endopeptidase MepM/ murein hydrolase activator NlpD